MAVTASATMRPKFTVPQLNTWVVPRTRLRDRIARLCERHQIVWIVGTAGSGKTTAVVELVRGDDALPTAWLTLDDSDAAPGRLLTHLEAAIAVCSPDAGQPASEALRSGAAHVEAATLLADSLPDRPFALVVDELEHLVEAPEAATALSALLRALHPSVRVILISRRSVTLRLGSGLGVGGVGRLDESDLALSVDEATALFDRIDHPGDIAPAEAVHATGGWIAGVLFEAWRSPHHTHGNGGETDALSGYLAAEIMADLSPSQQWFLTATSVLEDVTAASAAALGVKDAATTLASFRERFLPLWTSEDGTELRCHPRFRQYLRRTLADAGPKATQILYRHAQLLLDAGRPADAVVPAFAAGCADLARCAVEKAVPGALARGDVGIVARWLEQLGDGPVESSVVLTRGQLVVAVDSEAWSRGAEISDRLLDLLHRTAPRADLEPELAGSISACFSHVGRQADAMSVLGQARPCPTTDAWRSGIGLDAAGTDHHYRDRSPDCGEVVDGMLHRFDLIHGRLGQLLDSRPAPWQASRSSRVGALRASGRLRDAEELLGDWADPDRSPSLNRMRVELLLDLGRSEEAHELLESSADLARQSSPYCEHLHLLLDASVSLRYRADVGRARRLLAVIDRDPTAQQHRRVVEQLPLWHGLSDLLSQRFDSAQAHLLRSLEYMLTWDRQLYVPFAGVYLAEAAWHTGAEDLVDRAADAALHAATVQGSDHLLLQALQEFPMVLSRRLDSDGVTVPGWERVARRLYGVRHRRSSTTVVDRSQPQVRIHDLDDATIEVDGRVVYPRLSRSVELAAYLALPAHQEGVARVRALHELFDGREDDSAQAYLRRAVGALRSTVAPDCISMTESRIDWALPATTSDYVEFDRRAQEAMSVRGSGRIAVLEDALARTGTTYLPASRAEWVLDVRRELNAIREQLTYESAEAAYDIGDLVLAKTRIDTVLSRTPYRESAWRLAMRIAGDLGQDDQVIAVYQQCRDALAEVPADPSRSTKQLLERLRR